MCPYTNRPIQYNSRLCAVLIRGDKSCEIVSARHGAVNPVPPPQLPFKKGLHCGSLLPDPNESLTINYPVSVKRVCSRRPPAATTTKPAPAGPV